MYFAVAFARSHQTAYSRTSTRPDRTRQPKTVTGSPAKPVVAWAKQAQDCPATAAFVKVLKAPKAQLVWQAEKADWQTRLVLSLSGPGCRFQRCPPAALVAASPPDVLGTDIGLA